MDTKKWTMQNEIDRVLESMKVMSSSSKEYKQAVESLKVLLETKNTFTIKPDTLVLAAVNILGIILVLNFEKTGVIGSKAFSLFKRI